MEKTDLFSDCLNIYTEEFPLSISIIPDPFFSTYLILFTPSLPLPSDQISPSLV